VVKGTLELPPSQPLGWGNVAYLGNGHLATRSVERNDLTFLRIPPLTSQNLVEGWTIPPFAYEVFGYAVCSPENAIAVAERGEKWVTGVTSSFKALVASD